MDSGDDQIGEERVGARSTGVDCGGNEGSDEDAFDTTLTDMEVAPKVVLDLPNHVNFMRYKMVVRAAQDNKRFLKLIATPELEEKGAIDIKKEESVLLAERIMQILKIKDPVKSLVDARACFSLSVEWDDFDNEVGEFCQAFSVLLNYRELADATERKDFLSEAMAMIEPQAAAPTASSETGNPIHIRHRQPSGPGPAQAGSSGGWHASGPTRPQSTQPTADLKQASDRHRVE